MDAPGGAVTGRPLDTHISATRVGHYRTLGLEPSAPAVAVREMYRVLARRLHPDVSGSSSTTAAMSMINSAYQALVGRAAPAEFTIEAVPPVRRARSGSEAVDRYRQSMGEGVAAPGSLVDVLA